MISDLYNITKAKIVLNSSVCIFVQILIFSSQANRTSRSCIMVDYLENNDETVRNLKSDTDVNEDQVAEVLATLYGGTPPSSLLA